MTPPLEQTAARGTGIMLVKDYLGKNGKQEIWKFRAALEARILQTLKRAAIEEGSLPARYTKTGGITAGSG